MSGSRPSVLSGTWYPGDPDRLKATVDTFLAAAEMSRRPAGHPLLAVVPHAGYRYSGPSAGRLYGLLQGWEPAPQRVFILAPNHRVALRQIALSGADSFATPLGRVPVDTETVGRLASNFPFVVDDEAHAEEHAIEIQLPFLQRLWGQVGPAIVSMLVPHLDQEAAAAAATRLAAELGTDPSRRPLLLVSSDLTHYGASFGYVPFRADVPAALEKLDAGAILRILAADSAGLRDYGTRTGITMCGLEAAALALDSGVPPGHEGTLLDYARSGDQNGDYTHSVSYAAILLCEGPAADDGRDRDDGRDHE
jgi:hypothetical protein